jgi:hypothetical protein
MNEPIRLPQGCFRPPLCVELPAEYSGPEWRLLLYDQETAILLHPGQPPLLIDRETGALACLLPHYGPQAERLRWPWY